MLDKMSSISFPKRIEILLMHNRNNIKITLLKLIVGVLTLFFSSSCKQVKERKPNIIFILADDLGWNELGCYGNTFNETPNIDQMANEGMQFKQAYAAAPVCSPYRASFLTGQFPARVGILDYLRPEDEPLSTDHTTIAEILRDNGYATAMVGKWHLTGYKLNGSKNEVRATDHGFDEELVTERKGVGNGANFYPYHFRNDSISWTTVTDKKLEGKENLTDRITYEGLQFIEKNKDQPFFLYLSHFAPHSILNGKPEVVEKYLQKGKKLGKIKRPGTCYLCEDKKLDASKCTHWASENNPHLAAMIESIDDGVGQIMEKLEELGLAENTLIVFTSDNGGESFVTTNGKLRGGKSDLYEGGIREPLIIKYPKLVQEKSFSDAFTVNIDFYPTFLDIANIKGDEKQQLDGFSILPILKGENKEIKREEFYWHYPLDKPHFLGGSSSGAIRKGEWKLIEFFEEQKIELYNLSEDEEEEHNLAQKFPEKVKELHSKLETWRNDVGAMMYDGQKTVKTNTTEDFNLTK